MCLFVSPAIEWQQQEGLNYIVKKWSEMGQDEKVQSQMSAIIFFKKKTKVFSSKQARNT